MNIRDIIGHFIGRTIADITQHDEEEYQRTKIAYVQLLFTDGSHIRFAIGADGFWHGEFEDEENSEDTPDEPLQAEDWDGPESL